jgi:hypothetical protein
MFFGEAIMDRGPSRSARNYGGVFYILAKLNLRGPGGGPPLVRDVVHRAAQTQILPKRRRMSSTSTTKAKPPLG